MGDARTYDRLLRELATGVRAAVVFTEFGLVPELPYFEQLEQAYAALTFMAGNAGQLGLDASRIALAGDCTGAGAATSLALLAKRRRGPELAFQLLLYPVVRPPLGNAGSGAKDRWWFTGDALSKRVNQAFPPGMPHQDPIVCPLYATPLQLNDLPEAMVLVAECDVACEDGEEYARRLREAGVSVICVRYNGAIHDFMLLNVLAESPAARSALSQAIEALRGALYRP
ncbi:alpha/beta hydrolase fold domain-containing protein [Bradyrhizobium lablabi]|nr:alpha/beta hydrolase fold domain-containing protein [Bradyrhizobium lablabi]